MDKIDTNNIYTTLCIGGVDYAIPNTFLPTNIDKIIADTPYLENFAFDAIMPDFLPPSGFRFNSKVDRLKCIISNVKKNDIEYQKYTSRFEKLINTPTNILKPNLQGYPWLTNNINSYNHNPIDWIGKLYDTNKKQIEYVYIISNFSENNICEGLYENKELNYVLQFWFKNKYLNNWQEIVKWLKQTVGNWQKYAIQPHNVCDIIDNSE